jgi:glycerophosphoryl diester phosphodiesterase
VPVSYPAGPSPLAIAHRGGAGLAQENTLEAFARSHALGIRYLETDVRLTGDGIPVLFHDAKLRRITGQPGLVNQCRYRDLPPAIPTLEAALRAFPDTNFTIDVKDTASVAAVADVIRRTDAVDRICVAGAWDGTLDQLARALGPDLTVAMGWRALCRLVTSSHSRLPLVRRGRTTFAHVPLRVGRLPVFAERLVERAHLVGVRVLVWTVNDPAVMTHLLDLGADGIITDRPDLLREILIARDAWTVPGRSPSTT